MSYKCVNVCFRPNQTPVLSTPVRLTWHLFDPDCEHICSVFNNRCTVRCSRNERSSDILEDKKVATIYIRFKKKFLVVIGKMVHTIIMLKRVIVALVRNVTFHARCVNYCYTDLNIKNIMIFGDLIYHYICTGLFM
jgi:hypothetical protein